MRQSLLTGVGRKQRSVGGAVAVGALLIGVAVLSGCATREPPLPGVAGEPTPLPGTALVIESEPDAADVLVAAYAGPGELTLVTLGSGSCPTIPDVRSVKESEKSISVELQPFVAENCTADLAPRTFTFETPHDLSGFTVQVVRGSEEAG